MCFSCKHRKHNESSSNIEFALDSNSISVLYSELTFSIPSPNQTALLIKKNKQLFSSDILCPVKKTDTYTTSFKKALIMGIWGADLCYLNLYNQKELALPYFNNINKVIKELDITKPFEPGFLSRIENQFGNNDSLMIYLSELYQKCDEYLKYNEQNDVSSLIITGGWIESFYFLTNLYSQTKDKQIFALILYQKEVVNNLIKILEPFYNRTIEFKDLTDNLIDIAYEFDVIDMNNSIESINIDSFEKYSYVKNNAEYSISGQEFTNLTALSARLRDKFIN